MPDNLRAVHPLLRFYRNANVRFALFGIVLCSVPFLSSAGIIKVAALTTLASVLIYSVSALGMNLLLGYSGLISLGMAGFMGMGAYLAAIATRDWHLSFWLALVIAVGAATVLGLIVGLVSLRVSGLYLAIATLCVSEILLKTFEQLETITGGMQGKKASYPNLFGTALTRESTYILLAVFLILMMILTRNLVKGQFGRALHAMRGSEVAAQAMGVNLLKYRLLAFALSTAYAALAGALYVFFVKISYPSSWTMSLSLFILAAVVIGGFRSIYGSVLGTFVVFAVPDLFLKNLPVVGKISGLPYIFNGLLIILVIMFYPNGLTRLLSDIKALAVRPFARDRRRSVDA